MKSKYAIATIALITATGVSAATYHVPSTPQTIHRGIISPDLPPVLHIKSGDTVTIDTVSHGGLTKDPVGFFAKDGTDRGWNNRAPPIIGHGCNISTSPADTRFQHRDRP